LDSFLDEKAEEERQFQQLAQKTRSQYQPWDEAEEDGEVERGEQPAMMTVDEYRKVFSEKFGMSQFW
jgi:hypothetical protein